MSANDYIQSIKDNPKNKAVLKSVGEGKKLQLKWSEFEHQIRLAFYAGVQSGRGQKSVFEQVFG
jgi:hypothetical protein